MDCVWKIIDLIALFLTFVPVIFFWRGYWDVSDYLAPWSLSSNLKCGVTNVPDSFVSPLLFLIAGIFIRASLDSLCFLLRNSIQQRFLRIVVLKMYVSLQALLVVFLWKCVFDLLNRSECYCPAVGYLSASFCLLTIQVLRLPRILIANPAGLVMDMRSNVYQIQSLFQSHAKEEEDQRFNCWNYFDHLLSNFVNLMTAAVWWLVWEVSVVFIKINQYSYLWILIFGFLFITVAYVIEQSYFLRLTSDRNSERVLVYIFHVFISFLGFVGSLFTWRGGWIVLDTLVPVEEDPTHIHHALVAFSGLLIMLILNVGSTLTNRGLILNIGFDVKRWVIVNTIPLKQFIVSSQQEQDTIPIIPH